MYLSYIPSCLSQVHVQSELVLHAMSKDIDDTIGYHGITTDHLTLNEMFLEILGTMRGSKLNLT